MKRYWVELGMTDARILEGLAKSANARIILRIISLLQLTNLYKNAYKTTI